MVSPSFHLFLWEYSEVVPQQTSHPPSHRILCPRGGGCLVNHQKQLISAHMPNVRSLRLELLYSVMDTYLVDVEWVPVVEWCNDSGADFAYPVTLKTQLVVVNGRGIIGLFTSMDGLCIRSDDVQKTFRTEETISPEHVNLKFNVPTARSIVVYQRRWRFKHRLWFITTSDYLGEDRIVGKLPIASKGPGNMLSDEGEDLPIVDRFITSYIDSAEYFVANDQHLGNNSVKEVDIIPIDREYSTNGMRKNIARIPEHHRNAILKMLI